MTNAVMESRVNSVNRRTSNSRPVKLALAGLMPAMWASASFFQRISLRPHRDELRRTAGLLRSRPDRTRLASRWLGVSDCFAARREGSYAGAPDRWRLSACLNQFEPG